MAVFLAQNLARGGAERVFLHLVHELRLPRPVPVLVQSLATLAEDLGVAEGILTLATADGELPGTRERGGGDGIAARRPEAPARGRLDRLDETPAGAALSFPLKALRLRRIIRARDAAMVCTFLPKAHMIAALARAMGLRDRVYVSNVHCFMSQHIRYHFPRWLQPVARMLLGGALRRADAVFAVSEGVREDLIDTLRLEPGKVHVVWNPLDLDQVRVSAREPVSADELPPAPAGCLTLVGAGRLHRLKGFRLLIDALSRLPGDVKARAVLVGDGPERGALEAQVRRLGVGGAVHFVGEQANPWRFMARADVLVHPSYTEAFPTVFGEAMALGVPVIAAECSPGVREYLEDGACGVLVPPDDPESLARAIASLLRDPDARARLVERGTKRVEPFALRRAVDAHAAHLRRLLERRFAASTPGHASDPTGADAEGLASNAGPSAASSGTP